MNSEQRIEVSGVLSRIVETLSNDNDWVNFADIGNTMSSQGVSFKSFGYDKLRSFLLDFSDIFQFQEVVDGDKPPVYFARLKNYTNTITPKTTVFRDSDNTKTKYLKGDIRSMWLFNWANIAPHQIKSLAEMATQENWSFGKNSDDDEYSGLRNYLTYTFKRLCSENKVVFVKDEERNEEYAAFNTGLVDNSYDWIYALFKENTMHEIEKNWYLVGFVVAGEDAGKSLVKFFNPLPERADYFSGKPENMFYNTKSGELMCDYTHIILERIYRLPLDFLKENCPADYLTIDGIFIDDVYFLDDRNEDKLRFFSSLSEKLKDKRYFNRLRNRFDDAVNLALKKVEWNYKTAVPMYFPSKNNVSLLLPLSLCDEKVDLALVVTRHDNGSYQGETVLPLDIAYSNSRLITKPESDWLDITK